MKSHYETESNGATSRHNGFTLIELIVVIAVIAILAAILFPVFAQAREKARQTSCASNMKQLGVAVAQYVMDFDETYPAAVDTVWEWNYYNNGNPGSDNWILKILPYVKTTSIFTCPDDTAGGTSGWQGVICSYAANANITYSLPPYSATLIGVFSWGGASSWMSKDTVLQSTVTQPAATIMLYESHGDDMAKAGLTPVYSAFGQSTAMSGQGWLGNGTLPPATCGSSCTASFPNSVSGGVTTKHQGMANFLYCDGHVKMLPPTMTVDPASGWSLNSLNQWYTGK